MIERISALAEVLEDIDSAIQDAKDAMLAASTIYHQAFEAKAILLADRQRVVEQLEEIGIEDPEL